MLRGMYAGVSGLRTHQFKMDVIGNNIANVNTVGFKRSTATFKEVFNQTLKSASGSQAGLAGTNPQQVGLGVTQGSVSVVHTQGAPQTTGNPLDVMIDGNSFFMLSNDPMFLNRVYSRAGNFQVDEQGRLSSPDGYKVLGYKVSDDGIVANDPGELVVNKSDNIAPTATRNVEMLGNLNSSSLTGTVRYTDARIYDSLGNSYTAKLRMEKGSDVNTWEARLDTIVDANGETLYREDPALNTFEDDPAFSQTIVFGDNGKLSTISDPAGGTNPLLAQFSLNKEGLTFGDEDGNISIDFSALTQYGNDFTVEARRKDGNTAGSVDSFALNDKGELVARYTNGESKVLGIVALAKFENNSGLQKMGGNLYQNTRNSGDAVLGRAAQQGYGVLTPGRLEMSNVDLSYEFTEMITTQRGFQANSRIISTSDEILQELVNLKR